jgi:hypothetical protein
VNNNKPVKRHLVHQVASNQMLWTIASKRQRRFQSKDGKDEQPCVPACKRKSKRESGHLDRGSSQRLCGELDHPLDFTSLFRDPCEVADIKELDDKQTMAETASHGTTKNSSPCRSCRTHYNFVQTIVDGLLVMGECTVFVFFVQCFATPCSMLVAFSTHQCVGSAVG